jgi:hypothetical protein
MPAYRSDAEAEVRSAVVDRLRQLRPEARIMHEVNASSYGNRIDVLAVSPAEIIAVEIKSAKDKLDRLPDQLVAMRGCAHTVIAALHEKFLVEKPTHKAYASIERNGECFLLARPDAAPFGGTWIFPEQRRAPEGRHDDLYPWREPDVVIQQPLPAAAIDMLWRDELLEMCGRFSVSVPKRPRMETMVNALRWQLSGRDLTRGICAALRARACIEADAPIVEEQAKAA